jgi:hypothetical protein
MSTRREFMVGTVVASSALVLNASAIAASEQVLLVDYDLAHAHRLAADAANHGCRTLAITGDRVRFAREVFGPGAPEVVAGVTTYADFIVLTGCAAEAGYRIINDRAEGALVRWKVARLHRSIYSG